MLLRILLAAGLMAFGSVCQTQASKPQIDDAIVVADTSVVSASVVKDVVVNNNAGYDDYNQAWDCYYKAMQAYADVPQRTALFSKAIQSINSATTKESDNPVHWLLGSQIYRARGGVAYAKNYFAKACELYDQNLKKQPDSISFNLQYAIACYAGDAQYYPDYNAYKAKAVRYAKAALKRLEAVEINLEDKDAQELVQKKVLEQKFLASVILHDEKKITKLSEQIMSQCINQDLAYAMAADYELKVREGNWLWKVSDKESAEKAFLIYYLTALEN